MKHEPIFRVLVQIIEVICRRHLDDLRLQTDDVHGVPTLTILPHAADYPRLVGKHGAQINAMHSLVNRAAQRLNTPFTIALRESFIGDREPIEPFAFNPDFDVKRFQQHLEDLAEAVTGQPLDYRLAEVNDVLAVTVPANRNGHTETFLSELESVFKPYCYGSGRKLQLRPQFINHEANPEFLRQR